MNKILYADTLLMKTTFPKLAFIKVENPEDHSKIVASIDMQNLSNVDKNKLASELYHNTHTINGVFDVKKNKTTLTFNRGSSALSKTFKENFRKSSPPFAFKIFVDYNSKQIDTNYPSTNYSESFDSQLKKINFINGDNCLGTYTFQTNKGYYTNVVTLNKKYNNKITSDIIFSNNDFGVSEIVSLFDTTTLISVVYE
ncbi:hypothetical protein [Flavobacterium sp. LB3R33]|uniref:hypothetical protein n=1 Tax=Flavobacterium sp. LB3R33 TaxID=3401721 RepID=UPI003AAB9D28